VQGVLQAPLPEDEWLLLAGRELGQQQKGALVCSCHEVGAGEIVAAIRQGCRDVTALGRQLRCGTGCGSCLPELRLLLQREQAESAAGLAQGNDAETAVVGNDVDLAEQA
jgi:assimilatory nitrate reductase catalytic subunit